MVLLGGKLIRAGRGDLALRAGVGFALFFALSVQYFLFRWPEWMYAYAFSSRALPPSLVALPFFVAVAGAGTAGAYVSHQLLREGRRGWAWANVLFGIGLWLAIWAATWEPYFHVGTLDDWRRGAALPIAEVPAFQLAMNLAGAAQGAVGLGIAVWVVLAGRRALGTSRIQPDPAPDWRQGLVGRRPVLAVVEEAAALEGRSPRDGAPLEEVAATEPAAVAALVARARSAQQAWAALPVEERAARLRGLRRAFLAEGEGLAQVLERENGKPLAESWVSEILPSADLFDYWARRGPALLQAAPVEIDPLLFPGKRGVVELLPRGVMGLITPWNFPVALALRNLVPALLAGNAVVWKPSEHAPRSAGALERILAAHLPADLLLLARGGPEVGRALIGAGVDHVAFVGSPAAGREVARLAAEQLATVSLELGGKDAALVLHDADLERTADGVLWGALANAGQNCAAIERCYVDAAIAPAFVALLRDRIARLRLDRDLGPITTAAQAERIRGQLAEAGIDDGGEGQWMRPVLVVDPPPDLALLREETFGPVLPIVTVATEEEMVARANDSLHGLTASIWSRDVRRAERLGRRLNVGVVTINNHAFTGALPGAPWSGTRGSGAGITNGPLALAALTRPRLVVVDRSRARELWWYPYDESLLRLSRALARLRSGAGPGVLPEVIGGWWRARRRRMPPPASTGTELAGSRMERGRNARGGD